MNRSVVKLALACGLFACGLPAVEAAFFDNSAVEPNDYVEEGEAWKEEDLPLPQLPSDEDLLQVEVESASANKDFIDRKTLQVGKDGISRVTMVTRHKSGSQTVTREGIRCKTGQYRIYAIANGGQWSVPKASVWRDIPMTGYKTLRSELLSSVLCKDGFAKTPERAIKDVLYPPEEKNW